MSFPPVPWCKTGCSVPWLDESSSSSDSDDELLLLYSLTKRNKWVHPINKKRNNYGEFHHLMEDLKLDEDRFRAYFRLTPDQFEEVLRLIDEDIRKSDKNYREAISSKERLAICLRFLSTGDTYTTISFSYRVGISTVSKIVEEVCDAIWNRLQPLYMPTPDKEMWQNIESIFRQRWNFPHCIGAIDGKHVTVQAPPNSGTSFYNYKGNYSTVLLGLVDAEYKFICIDTGSYGKECDSSIFMSSALGKRLCSYSMDVPPDEPLVEGGINLPYVIVGDSGFPLKRFLLRPFPRDKNLDKEKRVFNYRLCRSRRITENAFGILAQRWRVFFRPLLCNIDTVQKIIQATTVLHNYLCCKGDVASAGTQEDIEKAYKTCWKPLPYYGARASDESSNVRNYFLAYFNSPEGSVPWQWYKS